MWIWGKTKIVHQRLYVPEASVARRLSPRQICFADLVKYYQCWQLALLARDASFLRPLRLDLNLLRFASGDAPSVPLVVLDSAGGFHLIGSS